MIEVEEMTAPQMRLLLRRVGYGHLGCARDNRPYVVPVNYAYDEPALYIFTTEGLKTDYIAANPEVCLQVEEVRDAADWRSVIVNGAAERLTLPEEVEHAMSCITERNPALTPALHKMWSDSWGRASVAAIYRIKPYMMSGRQTVPAGANVKR